MSLDRFRTTPYIGRCIDQEVDTRRVRSSAKCIYGGKAARSQPSSTVFYFGIVPASPARLVVIDNQAPPWRYVMVCCHMSSYLATCTPYGATLIKKLRVNALIPLHIMVWTNLRSWHI